MYRYIWCIFSSQYSAMILYLLKKNNSIMRRISKGIHLKIKIYLFFYLSYFHFSYFYNCFALTLLEKLKKIYFLCFRFLPHIFLKIYIHLFFSHITSGLHVMLSLFSSIVIFNTYVAPMQHTEKVCNIYS